MGIVDRRKGVKIPLLPKKWQKECKKLSYTCDGWVRTKAGLWDCLAQSKKSYDFDFFSCLIMQLLTTCANKLNETTF